MSSLSTGINWKKTAGVIFDLDGTLYDQRKLRLKMMTEMGRELLKNRHALMEIRVIYHFRKIREELAARESDNILQKQFALVARRSSSDELSVARIIEKWIYNKPLKYIKSCRLEKVAVFFDILREKGVKIGVLSDYPIKEKLAALELRADADCYSLETDIDALKPQTIGLEVVIRRMALDKNQCVLIGDRDSRDGVCARRLGLPFVLCQGSDFYKKIINEYETVLRQKH